MSGQVVVRRLHANLKGRDLYVGDIHGCYELFEQALERNNFDPAADRVISVGDLVDRGPDSERCLELLEESWFYAVMANHEDLLLGSIAYRNGDLRASSYYDCHMANGGGWIDAVAGPQLGHYAGLVMELPHVLVVGAGEQRINVVHAEFPDGTTDEAIDAGLPGVMPAELIWSRRIMRASIPLPAMQEGLSLTVCGHTPDENVRLRLSHLCLDTGAFFTGRLTMQEVRA